MIDYLRYEDKDHLNQMIKSGYLVPHGKEKGTWYSLP